MSSPNEQHASPHFSATQQVHGSRRLGGGTLLMAWAERVAASRAGATHWCREHAVGGRGHSSRHPSHPPYTRCGRLTGGAADVAVASLLAAQVAAAHTTGCSRQASRQGGGAVGWLGAPRVRGRQGSGMHAGPRGVMAAPRAGHAADSRHPHLPLLLRYALPGSQPTHLSGSTGHRHWCQCMGW